MIARQSSTKGRRCWKLRAKRSLASVLDEIHGVGPRRKSSLIQAFGSVARIEHASAEEIAERAHVPKELARRILSHLRKDP